MYNTKTPSFPNYNKKYLTQFIWVLFNVNIRVRLHHTKLLWTIFSDITHLSVDRLFKIILSPVTLISSIHCRFGQQIPAIPLWIPTIFIEQTLGDAWSRLYMHKYCRLSILYSSFQYILQKINLHNCSFVC